MNIFRLHYSLKITFKGIISLNFHTTIKKKVLLQMKKLRLGADK